MNGFMTYEEGYCDRDDDSYWDDEYERERDKKHGLGMIDEQKPTKRESIRHASEEAEFLVRVGHPYVKVTGQSFYPIFKLTKAGQPKPPEKTEIKLPRELLQQIYSQDDRYCLNPVNEDKCRFRTYRYDHQCTKNQQKRIGELWFCLQHRQVIRNQFGI